MTDIEQKALALIKPGAVCEANHDNVSVLITALRRAIEQAEAETVAGIVAALLTENGCCDCFAKEEGECACGGWDDYKTWPLERVADWLSSGEWKE